MIRFKISIALITIVLTSCSNNKDMDLYINNHLNDISHIGNQEIYTQKEKVLKKIIQFDKWYRLNYGVIEYQFDVKFWNVGWNINVDDKFRISFLKDSVIPVFKEC
jgi:hypothetical protein